MMASSLSTRRLLLCATAFLVQFSHISSFFLPIGTGLVRQRNNKIRNVPCVINLSKQSEDTTTTTASLSESSTRGTVLITAIGSLSTVALAAKGGLLGYYPDATILQDLGGAVLCGVLGFLYVKLITWLASKDILKPRDSRKLIHTGSAPLYMVFWPLFSPNGRFFAACIPLINAARLYLASTGETNESELANAVSRSGDVKEALGGPFLYVIIMIVSILSFWTDNCSGIIAMCTMAAGDGMADIVGRRLGNNNKWFFAPNKSIAGSAAFWVSGTSVSLGVCMWLSTAGCLTLPVPMPELAFQIAWITAICALIELLPIGDDNWTVPVSAAVLSFIFLT
jgi:phytol kinase